MGSMTEDQIPTFESELKQLLDRYGVMVKSETIDRSISTEGEYYYPFFKFYRLSAKIMGTEESG